MKKLYFLMSFLLVALIGTAAEVTDVLTSADLTATGTTYTNFSGVTKASGAVYAGNTSLNNGISLRSKSNSGIVTTTSGGTAVSVTFTWHNATLNGRTLEIYGSTTPYTQSPDLYGANKGTLITTAVYNSATPTLTVPLTGDYKYIGIKSKSGAQYLTEIQITWSDGVADTAVDAPVFTPAAGTYEGPQNITIESTTPGAIITYSINAGPEQTYTTPIALTEVGNYSIKAKATDPNGKLTPSAEVVADYVITVPSCEAPTFSVKEGTYYEAQKIVITTATTGANIAYSITKNDLDHTPLTTVASPATITLPMESASARYTITAKAVKAGNPDSPEVIASYTLNPEKPTGRMFLMVKDASEIMAGDKVIFVREETEDGTYIGDVALAGKATGKTYGDIEHIEVVEGTVPNFGFQRGVIVTSDKNTHVYDVAGDATGFTFQDEKDKTFLGASAKNTLEFEVSATTNNEKWTVSNKTETLPGSKDITGVVAENIGQAGRFIEYNQTSPRFACYKSSQKTAYIFKYSAELSGVESTVTETNASINAIAGGVVVTVSEPTMAAVYTVSGQMVASKSVSETTTISLPTGFYIVKAGNSVKKVIVR